MRGAFLDFLALFNLLGVAQGVLLSTAFWVTRQGNRRSNRLLGLFLAVGVFVTVEILACYTDLIRFFPWFINTTEPLVFLIGPLAYLYTLSLIEPVFSWRRRWLHFVPALIFLVLRLPFLLQTTAYKLRDVRLAFHHPAGHPVPVRHILWFPDYSFGGVWLDLVAHPLMLAYCAYSFYRVWQFARQRGESVWRSPNQSLRGLVRLMTFFVVFMLVVACISFLSEDDMGDIYIATVASMLFCGITFWVLQRSPGITQQYAALESEKRKYGRSGLDAQMTSEHMRRLEAVMTAEKPHRDPNLTLPGLAAHVRMSPHHLSQLLNEQAGRNFADFVNEHRVEEMKRKLRDPALAHFKIEELAFDSGFNSKSVFNAAFKKCTGVTPSQFRKDSGA